MNKKIKIEIAVAIIIFFSVLIAGSFLINKNKEGIQENKQVACTEEAKLCPDGSFVGRVGPNCEFAECPNDEIEWMKHQDKYWKIEYEYPRDWTLAEDDSEAREQLGASVVLYKKSLKQNEDSSYQSDASISIQMIDNPNNLSLQELFNRKYEECKGKEKENIELSNDPGFGCGDIEDISGWRKEIINSRNALRSGKKYSEGIMYGLDLVYIEIPEKFMVITIVSKNDRYSSKITGIFDRFISTIKFN